MPDQTAKQRYKIGAVSKLTGIPPVTLRMWERRYDAVIPERTEAGGRLYSDSNVRRLRLIKQATDQGYAISTLANLDEAALQARLANTNASEANGQVPKPLPAGPLGLCMINGDGVDGTLLPPRSAEHLIVCEFGSVDEVRARSDAEHPHIDVLLVRLNIVNADSVRDVAQARATLAAAHFLVVYDYGASAHIDLIRQLGGHAIQSPIGSPELLMLCRSILGRSAPAFTETDNNLSALLGRPIPERRYSASMLKQCAQLSSAVKCECPEHLAKLIEQLAAFERYSAHCESANREDAAMHMMLHAATAQVRRTMEDALKQLLDFEGLDVPESLPADS